MDSMKKKPLVQIRNLKKAIDGKPIIHGLNFAIHRGEVFGFLGPNGAGKTTTIRLLVGLMAMTEGEVLINGYSVRREFKKAIAHVARPDPAGGFTTCRQCRQIRGHCNPAFRSRGIPVSGGFGVG